MARRGGLGQRSQRHDAAYSRAKREGFAARAVYKLTELDQRFRLLGPRKRVLDLGCWPGSWMQYAAERVGEAGFVVGIDLKPVETPLPPWTASLVADVETLDVEAFKQRFEAFDVVLSDMAPHTTGDRAMDKWRSEELFLRALELATALLRPGGHFAAKVFQGGRFGELGQAVRKSFQESKAFHADATRTHSTEQYIVGRGLKRVTKDATQPTEPHDDPSS